jgi:hypothetical protein
MPCHTITVNWADIMCFPHHPWLCPLANADGSWKRGIVHTSSPTSTHWHMVSTPLLLPVSRSPPYTRQVWHPVLSAPVALSSCCCWTPWLHTTFPKVKPKNYVWNLAFNPVFIVKYDSPWTATLFNIHYFVLIHSSKGRNHLPVKTLGPHCLITMNSKAFCQSSGQL